MKGWVFVAFVLFSLAMPAMAEDIRGGVEAIRTQIQADKKEIIAQVLNLDSASSAAFWPLYNDYANDLRKVNDKRVDLISKYAKSYDTLTDEQAMVLVRESIAIDSERSKLLSQYLKKFEKILPGKQVARFFQTEHKLDAVITAKLAEEIPLVSTEAAEKLAGEQEAASK